jgi:hypothetical protein
MQYRVTFKSNGNYYQIDLLKDRSMVVFKNHFKIAHFPGNDGRETMLYGKLESIRNLVESLDETTTKTK